MKLSNILKKHRLINELTVRTLAADIGISPATLVRLEKGHDCDAGTLVKIINWLCSDKGEA